MTRAIPPTGTSWESIDELVRILDGANLIVHALDGRILRWTAGCAQLSQAGPHMLMQLDAA